MKHFYTKANIDKIYENLFKGQNLLEDLSNFNKSLKLKEICNNIKKSMTELREYQQNI